LQTTFADPRPAGRLTASGGPDGEARAFDDLRRVADAIEEAFPDLLTLAVIGAFGRGEGAMVRTEAGVAPWNDYDLLLVTPTRGGWERISAVCRELKTRLGLPGIDIVPFTPKDLVRAADTMLVHDARAGHHVIRGDGSTLAALPARSVARREALILLLNRMVCLLECPPRDLTGLPEDPLRFPSQVSKAVMAVIDAALVRAGEYAVTYREKVARFKSLAPGDVLVPAAEDALSFRFEPGPRQWDPGLWHLAGARLLDAIGEFVGCPGSQAERTGRRLWRDRFRPVRHTARSLLRGRLPDARRRAVECAEVLVLAASRREGEERAEMLREARGFIERSAPMPPFTDWHQAARLTVGRWFEICYG
jgi:hypothetical protein